MKENFEIWDKKPVFNLFHLYIKLIFHLINQGMWRFRIQLCILARNRLYMYLNIWIILYTIECIVFRRMIHRSRSEYNECVVNWQCDYRDTMDLIRGLLVITSLRWSPLSRQLFCLLSAFISETSLQHPIPRI